MITIRVVPHEHNALCGRAFWDDPAIDLHGSIGFKIEIPPRGKGAATLSFDGPGPSFTSDSVRVRHEVTRYALEQLAARGYIYDNPR